MSLIETFQMAVQNILSSKMRTFLTMLGIIIGVCAVIVIVGLGNGMQGYIEDSFADMGTDSLTVMVMGRGSSRSVSEGEMYQLVADNSDVFKQISPTVTMSGSVKIGSSTLSATSVTGVSEDYFSMKGYEVAQGRGLQYTDMTGRKKVCIVGQYLNQVYYGGNAVGQTLRINGNSFTIVGVMGMEGTELEEGGTDDCVFLPYSTAARLSFTGTISSYTITVQDTDQISQAKTTLENALYEIFEDDDAYTVGSMAEMVEEMNSMVNMVIYILAGIAAISLVVGGIGIMNIMLVYGADQRDRHPQGAWGPGGRHHAPVRHRGGYHLLSGRRTGDRPGLRPIRGGHGGHRQCHTGHPHHRQPQHCGDPGGLRCLRGHRHRLRIPPRQKGRGAEPHRCAAV